MGRHSTPRTTNQRTLLAWLLAGGLVLVSVIGYASWRLTRDDAPRLTAGSCTPVSLNLTVDPLLAPLVPKATTSLDPACVKLRITAQSSPSVAAQISRPQGVGLGGNLPDVWIPDSSSWLANAQGNAAGKSRITGDTVSLAHSPVVVAMTKKAGDQRKAPQSDVSWADLTTKDRTLRLGISDPRSSTAALAALLAAVKGSPTEASVATINRRLTLPGEAQSPAELVANGSVDAMPTSEVDMVRAERAGTARNIVAGYDAAFGRGLDFPLVTLAASGKSSAARSAAIADLKAALTGSEARRVMTQSGLRDPDGNLGDGVDPGVLGIRKDVPNRGKGLTASEITAAATSWALAGRRSSLTAVVDLSGSMQYPLAGGTVTKGELAKRSLSQLIATAPGDTKIGIRTFTTVGRRAALRVLVPTAALDASTGAATTRAQLTTAIVGMDPVPAGDTPLYHAVVEAYRQAQDDYSYGRLNAVILVTDGRNDDPDKSWTEAKVLSELRLLYDGIRPVRIIAIGFGPGSDLAGLKRMADVTGGVAYQGLTEGEATALLPKALTSM